MLIPQSYEKIKINGLSPFKQSFGTFEVQISLSSQKIQPKKIMEKNFSVLWKENFHLIVKNSMFEVILGTDINPIPSNLLRYDFLWVIISDQLSSVYSMFKIKIDEKTIDTDIKNKEFRISFIEKPEYSKKTTQNSVSYKSHEKNILINTKYALNKNFERSIDNVNKLGDKGPQGIIGDKGSVGDKGEKGISGIQGDKGIRGIQGSVGDKGEKGISGIQGDKGYEAGSVGDKGEKGISGIQGDKGIRGIQGPLGDKGIRGIQGPLGDKGIRGIQG